LDRLDIDGNAFLTNNPVTCDDASYGQLVGSEARVELPFHLQNAA
jgi:hypothetical protein